MKVKIKKGTYFYHPPRDAQGKKKPIAVVSAGNEIDVPEAEADRLVKLGTAEIVREEKSAADEKPRARRNSKPKAEPVPETVPESEEAPEDDDPDNGDIVV